MDPRTDGDSPELPASAVVASLVARHREFLAFLERRVGDRAAAEDLLQEAFVRGIDKAGALRDDEAAVAWFYRVLRNALVDHRRRSASGVRALEVGDDELLQDAETRGELEAVACKCVAELATTLKPDYALALKRIEVDGVSVKDFAAEVGITSGNAAIRVFRAREALRQQVHRSCRTCAEHGCLDCTCARSEGGHAGD